MQVVKMIASTYKCKNNNWMHYGSTNNDTTWVMSPFALPVNANVVWHVRGGGRTGNVGAARPLSAFPTIYLKSNVLIDSGKGTSSDPYELSL